MDGCRIFHEELAIRYPGHGHALWEPDPGGLYEAVEVGDVGFIRRGYFYRLFNALLPRDSPSDPESCQYPPQLQPKNPQHIRKSQDSHQDFYSKNVTRLPSQSEIYALGPDDTPQLTFSCSGKQGALLYLPLPADHEETIALGDFSKWIVKNIDDCLKVAEYLGCGVNRTEDIVLVTGRHLARSWISAAFSESRGGAQVSFRVRVFGDSGVNIEERSASGGELKCRPSGRNLPENQCVFVQGYRVFRILNIWPRIRAAGSIPDMHDPEPESDMHLEPIGIPSEADYLDPLHILLEYIAEQAFDCDSILVHDSDLGFIGGALQSDTLTEHIRNHPPTIHQVRCEIRNQNGPGVEAEITTVATLSQDLFEAQREDTNDLDLMSSTSGSDNEISSTMSQENAAHQSSDLLRSMSVSPTNDDLSNVAAIPAPTDPSHEPLPDPIRPSLAGSPIGPPQSDFRMNTATPPLTEPTSPPATTHSTPDATLVADLESHISEEPEDLEQRPVDVENAMSTTAVINTHIARHLSINSPGSSRGDSDGNTAGSGAGTGFSGSATLAAPRLPISYTASESRRAGSGIFRDIVADLVREGGSLGSGRPTLPITSSHSTSSSVSSLQRLKSVNDARVSADDILVDGFLAHTFSPQDARAFFTLLLRTPDFLRYYHITYSRGVWYITQNAPYAQQSSLGIPTQIPPLALDFSVKETQGTVVPQRRWTPTVQVDFHRFVAEATLQIPIFFVNRNGGVGFWLPDILQGRDHDLNNRDSEASLGGIATTHIRINWPGYGRWQRQIPTRDATRERNPITLHLFMKHVAASVDKFFNDCMAKYHGADPRWAIGPRSITQEDVKIIGVVHVSAGGWMPLIQLTRYVV